MKEPTKIMIAGDWHGSGHWGQAMIQRAKREGVDCILHLGDFGLWSEGSDTDRYLRFLNDNLEECGIELFWVDGNHENHDRLQGLIPEDRTPWCFESTPHIMHLPRGYRWNWWGKDFMALGGAFSVDRYLREEGKGFWPGETLTEADIAHATREGNVDVIIAHDCPWGVDIPGIGRYSKQRPGELAWPEEMLDGAEAHRKLMRQVTDVVKPEFFFHGHYHTAYAKIAHFGLGPDAYRTQVIGLDCDGSSFHRNTHILLPTNSMADEG